MHTKQTGKAKERLYKSLRQIIDFCFQKYKEEEVNKGIIRVFQRQKSRNQMPEEVGIAEKLNELSASLFIREEDELLPKRDMRFLSEINETQKNPLRVKK